MTSLSKDEIRRGVVAASAGNHGQGVAWIAREMGIEATVYVPSVIPSTKREAIERSAPRSLSGGTKPTMPRRRRLWRLAREKANLDLSVR